MTFHSVSMDSVMLYFEQVISEKVLDEVQRVYLILKEMEGMIDLTPSYTSILVQFDGLWYDHQTLEDTIRRAVCKENILEPKKSNKLIHIPTNYEKNLDLQRVATYHHLSTEEVIAYHTQRTYRVYAIGFLVGFGYLASVDTHIITPRLETPRKKVPKGAVALAENQTAIYPQDSAGGWNIIGHTEFNDFDTFEIGDEVRFERV